MATTIGNEYEHIDFTHNNITTRHPIKDATARSMVGDIVKISDSDPQLPNNKIWIKETPNAEVQVPTYAEFQELDGDVDDLKSAINYNVNSYSFTGSASFTTDASFKSGDRVVIDVESNSGVFSVWTLNYTSTVYVQIGVTGKFIITLTNDGPLRFYMNTSGTITGKIYIQNRLSDAEDEISILNPRVDGIEDKISEIGADYYKQTSISSWKQAGYRLNGNNGLYHVDENYDVRFFNVTAGDIVEIDSRDMFQFQTSAAVSTSTDRRIGNTFGAGKYFLKVPTGATCISMSYQTTDTNPTVKKSDGSVLSAVTIDVANLHDKLKYFHETYIVKASTEHASTADRVAVGIPAGSKFDILLSSSIVLSSSSVVNVSVSYSDGTSEFVASGCKVPSITSLTANKNIVSVGFWSGSSFSSSDVTITVDIYVEGSVLTIDQEAIPVLDDFQIKTIKVLDSFSLNVRSYSFSSGATIKNYNDYATSSSIAYNTPPIKVRNKDGKLIYKDLHFATSQNAQVYAAWTFDINGNYLRYVTFAGMLGRQTPFLSDEYYAILNEYPTTSGYTESHWYVSNVEIEWLNNKGKNTYTVGTDGDFATFTQMLIALEDDDSEKTVYVKGGTYDIFTEMGGAEYVASVAPTASQLNWRDVCHVVPPNTTIIGIGNVVLTWNATAQQMIDSATAFLFSPLNVSGTCRIENISVVGQNCRYTVHDETSGLADYNGAKHSFKNCRFTMLSGTYGGAVFGSGHNKLMEFQFEDCVFDSQNSDIIWSTHDWPTPLNDNSLFIFNNCVFISTKNDPKVGFSSDDTYGRLDKVMFDNCYLNKIRFTTGGGSAKQGYDVQLIGCTPVEIVYTDQVTDRVTVRQYNSIPQS